MKSLISINSLFMSLSPKELVHLILESKYTKGVEACIDASNVNELKYLDELAFELQKNHLILQIHGEIMLDMDKQLEFFKKIEEYSDLFHEPIIVTMHSFCDEDSKLAIEKTVEYLSFLMKSIDCNKVVLCLENLNDTKEFTRLGKEEIQTTILNDEKIYFTYDIGHEIADFGQITDLDSYMIEEIFNVHLHSDNKGVNHLPIYKNDPHWNEILKALTFLINHHYAHNIVYEYGLPNCRGNTAEEKVKDYLESIDFVSERYSRD